MRAGDLRVQPGALVDGEDRLMLVDGKGDSRRAEIGDQLLFAGHRYWPGSAG